MIKVDYLHIAEDVKIDEKGRNSIIGIAGRLDVPSVPVGLTGVKITAGIRALDEPVVDETLNIRMSMKVGGKETVLFEVNQKVTIEVGYTFAPIFDIDNLIFPEFGNYEIELYVNGDKLADTLLMVKDSAELQEA